MQTDTTKNGYTFNKWSEVKDMVKEERKLLENLQRKSGGVYKFHYHGLKLAINDNLSDEMSEKISLSALREMVLNAEDKYPNSNIKIWLEGHYDFWETYSDMFNKEEYFPSDDYVEVLLYNKSIQ